MERSPEHAETELISSQKGITLGTSGDTGREEKETGTVSPQKIRDDVNWLVEEYNKNLKEALQKAVPQETQKAVTVAMDNLTKDSVPTLDVIRDSVKTFLSALVEAMTRVSGTVKEFFAFAYWITYLTFSDVFEKEGIRVSVYEAIYNARKIMLDAGVPWERMVTVIRVGMDDVNEPLINYYNLTTLVTPDDIAFLKEVVPYITEVTFGINSLPKDEVQRRAVFAQLPDNLVELGIRENDVDGLGPYIKKSELNKLVVKKEGTTTSGSIIFDGAELRTFMDKNPDKSLSAYIKSRLYQA